MSAAEQRGMRAASLWIRQPFETSRETVHQFCTGAYISRPAVWNGPGSGASGQEAVVDLPGHAVALARRALETRPVDDGDPPPREDRKSTRLNSSHLVISYAVF